MTESKKHYCKHGFCSTPVKDPDNCPLYMPINGSGMCVNAEVGGECQKDSMDKVVAIFDCTKKFRG